MATIAQLRASLASATAAKDAAVAKLNELRANPVPDEVIAQIESDTAALVEATQDPALPPGQDPG